MMLTQLKLPYRNLKCANPGCKQDAGHNDYFCSMSCYEEVRIRGLSQPRRDVALYAVALAALVATACTFCI